MGSLGERLKREREAKGISQREISERTRIGVPLLQAIEQEAFERLPGGIFNKSFVRQYARCVGVDEEEAVQCYLEASGETRKAAEPADGNAEKAPTARARGMARKGVAYGVLAAALGLGTTFYLSSGRATDSEEPSAAAASLENTVAPPVKNAAAAVNSPSPVAPVPQQQEAASGAAPVHAVVSDPVQKKPEPGPAPTSVPSVPEVHPALPPIQQSAQESEAPLWATRSSDGELLLEISAHDAVWLAITADGEKEWQGTLAANHRREVVAADSIHLTVGNAGGVQLTLNGQPLGSLGAPGEVKTLTISSRGLSSSTP